jgi:hypothetical protein
MQMHLKFTVEYLKTRGGKNSSDNGIEFLESLLVRISCQMNFARLNRSLHTPPGCHGNCNKKQGVAYCKDDDCVNYLILWGLLAMVYMYEIYVSCPMFPLLTHYYQDLQ